MKKIVAVLAVVFILFTTSVTVFAEPGGFVQSPSTNGAPVLIEEDSDDNIKITAYRYRNEELNATQIAEFEKAYKSVVGEKDLSKLVADLTGIAEAVNVDVANLAVSDLFYLSLISGEDHTEGATYDVSVKADTFVNFICLLKFDDGVWTVVDGAELKGAKVVDFVADDLGSYAVVVSVGEAPEYPGVVTPDVNYIPWMIALIILAIAAIVAGTFLVITIIYKTKFDKKKND